MVSSGSACGNEDFETTITFENPCDSTTINDPGYTDQEVYLDDDPKTITITEFTDSVSFAKGDADFCGTRTYSFNPTGIITVVSPTSW